ncbi:MAG: dihydroneopterin aldolase [Cyanobacteria bacterium]|nr:dihydroneopterin aldolase [Cyanobacteriota bacterium]
MPKASTDCIIIKNIQAYSKLGIYDYERELGQSLLIDLELELDLERAGLSDKVADSIDYAAVSLAIRRLAQSKEYLLIEHLAREIITMLFSKFDKLEGVLVEVKKTIVNAEQFSGEPSIRIYRSRL